MWSIMKQTDKTTTYVSELLADSASDLETIEVDTFAPGTTCLVIEDSSVYILDFNKEWKLL